ncbi:GTP-dependent dephospho-CoA kinase family protein [Halomicrobium salinisoli]|uniref:GTP-dependent dephospho-CoA kinase family protein n=1 Tax=Halomicrobium salinisoli TaxID=2878391 RepID=UPI001CF0D3F8|nr:GTP-dependent dephospho-CoA kinase family protein [Halomicrobium salinisoli]
MSDVVLELPGTLRSELKAPFGPIYTDADALLADAGEPVVAVGDIVTYHLLEAGYVPAVAFVDERTKRADVDPEVREAIEARRSDAGAGSDADGREPSGFDRERTVDNPPATLTAALLSALSDGLAEGGTTLVRVDGEEDLASLPAALAVPEGGSVVYGQPDEGMVLVTADDETRERIGSIVDRMDGDAGRALSLLGV